jgi:ubiquitin-protein ligase E3 A
VQQEHERQVRLRDTSVCTREAERFYYQQAFRRTLQSGHPEIPVLIFKIRRQHLLSDSVRELSHKAPEDLRKELRVSFIGEEALDEGGVQKEWFQLVIRLIFDPNYGMFTLDPGTHNYWFSTTSQDFAELTLIGKVLPLVLLAFTSIPDAWPCDLQRRHSRCPLSAGSVQEDDGHQARIQRSEDFQSRMRCLLSLRFLTIRAGLV